MRAFGKDDCQRTDINGFSWSMPLCPSRIEALTTGYPSRGSVVRQMRDSAKGVMFIALDNGSADAN